jgi:hypothetical protein
MTVQRCPSCLLMVPVVRDVRTRWPWMRAWRMAYHRPHVVPEFRPWVMGKQCPTLVLTPLLDDREVCSV